MKIKELIDKIYYVIHSCKTIDQLHVAKKYLQLASDNGYIAEELRVAIYLSIYSFKLKELEN
jgi:hypothetical protein